MQRAVGENGHPRPPTDTVNGDAARAARRSGPASEPAAGSLERDLTAVAEALFELAALRWQRVRLAAKEGAHTALLAVWLGLVAVIVTAVAAFFCVTGLAGGLAALSGGRVWVGRLSVGILGLVAGRALLHGLRARMRRLFVAGLTPPSTPTSLTKESRP